MSGRIFQNVVVQMKDSVDRPLGVTDEQGIVVASTDPALVGTKFDDFDPALLKNGGQPFGWTHCHGRHRQAGDGGWSSGGAYPH